MKVYLVSSETSSPTGLGGYTEALYQHARRIPELDLHRIPISEPSILSQRLFSLAGIDWLTVKQNFPLWWSLPDDGVIHFTNQQQGLSLAYNKQLGRRSIVTVHDLIPLMPISQYSLLQRLLFKLSICGIRRAAHIIVDSEHTKYDVMKYLTLSEERITVIPLGINTKRFKPLHLKKKQYSILYVGSEEPRKNFLLVLEAFALLKKKLPQAKLIKVGLPQWPDARQKALALMDQLGLNAQDVLFKGYVKDIVEEYNRAELFVFPSLYEGFGFPVLEAMACGTPVISSNKTSLPEVGGNAAMYVDGSHAQELAEKMYVILTDPLLKKNLREKGLRHVQNFSWDRSVKKVVHVYRTLFKNRQ